MSEKLSGGLGLTGNYKEGEHGWTESMNKNLETLNDLETVNGKDITIIGNDITASGDYGVAIGRSINGGSNSLVIGEECDNSGDSNIILGRNNKVENGRNIIIGNSIHSDINGLCNIILVPQNSGQEYHKALINWSVRIGTGNTNANMGDDSSYGQIVVGLNNNTDGSHNIIIGQENRNTYSGKISEGYGSITIGIGNQQYGSYNSLIGHGNRYLYSESSSDTRAHVLGSENDISGFECSIIGSENKFSPDGSYQSVNIEGSRNNIQGNHFCLSVVGASNNISSAEGSSGQDIVILGHNNRLAGAFRQTVVGSSNNISETATDTTVIGININAEYSNVTYLGNGASISFENSSKDYRFVSAPYQFSYLTHEATYKSNPSLNNRDWYTGKDILALKQNTILANVADGADDNHAVSVRQLKKLANILNNDYFLFEKANEFAVYNILPDEPEINVQWNISNNADNNTINTQTLSTKSEKEAWINASFTVIKDILDPQGEVIAKLLKYIGTDLIQIKNTGTSLDGSVVLDTLPPSLVLNGGYDVLNEASTVGFMSPINKPEDWDFNHSLHPISAETFYLTPSQSN